MLSELANFLGFSGVASAIVLSVIALFWKGDDLFSTEFKDDIALALLCLKAPSDSNSWTKIYVKVFEKIFGSRHLSWKCILNSILFSTFFYLACLYTIISLFGADVGGIEEDDFYIAISISLLFGIPINLFGDYLSLWQTRIFLKILSGSKYILISTIYLFIDFMLSALLFVIIFSFALSLLQDPPHLVPHYLVLFWFKTNPALQAMVISALVPSLWLWFYFIGVTLLRAASQSRPLLIFLQYALPIESRPVRSIGIVASLVTGVLFVIVAGLGVHSSEKANGVPIVPEITPELPITPELTPDLPVVPEPVPDLPVVPEPVPDLPVVPEPVPDLPVVPEPDFYNL
ncbi:hypothetical protein [uncultured Roseibium sp.]|uniref:hypothetical protein n=1 Tax=uncultured Roseibium sp. TaxID=1936171 RepID=UPI00261083CE|nr:hypothetical protein [uncultured Roseibium sp.]